MTDSLSSIFRSVAFKTLALVDLPLGSHQHEINGVTALRSFFETESFGGKINWHFFSDNTDPLHDTGEFRFYDARAKSSARTGRSEWRMYYSGEFLSRAKPGDVLILARTLKNEVLGLIFEQDSALKRAAQILFQIKEFSNQTNLFTEETLKKQALEFAKYQILDELGIEAPLLPLANDDEIAKQELNLALEQGKSFPSTGRMSQLAQSLIKVDFSDADSSLVALIEREERLFKAVEKLIVEEKLRQGFESVDDFINYSLSVQNRRKSRMGQALQNHLSKIFTEHSLRFDAQARTEGKNTPDFLFPGKNEYHDINFNADLLIMLAAKSSCKERWRQVLDEANRIANKHLCTLEQAISIDQTQAMKERNVRLIVPKAFQPTYSEQQISYLWTLNQFIDFVKLKQR